MPQTEKRISKQVIKNGEDMEDRLKHLMLALALLLPMQAIADENLSSWRQFKLQKLYLGASIGQSIMEPNTGDSGFRVDRSQDFGYEISAGYDWTRFIAMEADWADLGSVTLDPYGAINYKVFSLGGLVYPFAKGNTLLKGWSPFVKGGVATLMTSGNMPVKRDHALQIMFGAGVEYFVDRNWSIRLDGVSYDDDAALNSIGIIYHFSKPQTMPESEPAVAAGTVDSDGDGILNSYDSCDDTEVGMPVDESGCELDSDKDGIVDRADLCPETSSGITVDQSGCDGDLDKDKVANTEDKCPNTLPRVRVDEKGCSLDDDMDGVHNTHDHCPGTPAGIEIDNYGCEQDKDKDGVPNWLDQCPETVTNIKINDVGCAIFR